MLYLVLHHLKFSSFTFHHEGDISEVFTGEQRLQLRRQQLHMVHIPVNNRGTFPVRGGWRDIYVPLYNVRVVRTGEGPSVIHKP